MESFVVLEVTVNAWTGNKTNKLVMQSESELLCYRQALVLQRITENCDYGEDEIYYEVVSEEDFNV